MNCIRKYKNNLEKPLETPILDIPESSLDPLEFLLTEAELDALDFVNFEDFILLDE